MKSLCDSPVPAYWPDHLYSLQNQTNPCGTWFRTWRYSLRSTLMLFYPLRLHQGCQHLKADIGGWTVTPNVGCASQQGRGCLGCSAQGCEMVGSGANSCEGTVDAQDRGGRRFLGEESRSADNALASVTWKPQVRVNRNEKSAGHHVEAFSWHGSDEPLCIHSEELHRSRASLSAVDVPLSPDIIVV